MRKTKFMKKVSAVILLSSLSLLTFGCSNPKSNKDTKKDTKKTTEVATEANVNANNSLTNGDFEANDFSGWETTGDIITVRNDEWATVNKTYFVKMSADAADASFEVKQSFKSNVSGDCAAGIDFEGAASFAGSCKLTVEANGKSASVDFKPSKDWDFWEKTSTSENPIKVEEGDVVTITITGDLKKGDWGDFDNIVFDKADSLKGDSSNEKKSFDNIAYGGAKGSGSIDYKGITYNGMLINNGNYIKGVDISSVLSVEKSGFVYKNADGSKGDLFKILADNGINCVRVRIWNDPYKQGPPKSAINSYGGGVCDLDYAVEIAKRCKKAGISFFPDFHYSDWWSDPGRSICPKAWEGMSVDEKAKAAAEFTTEALKKIGDTGVNILIASVGNETNNFMAGESGIENIAIIMKDAAEAIRAYDKNILIAVHFTNPEKTNYLGSYAKPLDEAGVDYDIFASSYYPFWHGTLDNLKSKLDLVADNYGKLTMIAEYSYSYMGSQDATATQKEYKEASPENQYDAIKLINEFSASINNCIGTFYWEPAWPLTDESTWDEYGSGWTSSIAKEYDPNTAPEKAQGSACYEQSWFDQKGNQNPVLSKGLFKKLWKDK
ncbi:glycosyl hydrolase 53 family protein [Eubacterium sp.]|uniref:glycosyl hydrolase 53 family protein n=1 Tax=Eubacterium sp. TaxID=142586 RepID=UPI0025EF0BE7|nr:glycosyl hydrolase 53 family protein [Eubacterium sp.]MCR5628341.1 arabinogalactan endo-1,4-beta-galactosidase [Eubacterium sp.]